MEVKQLFPTPLVITEIEDTMGLVASLREKILAQEQANAGTQHSNQGGWQSSDNFLEWTGEAGETLFAGIRGMLWRCTTLLKEDGLSDDLLDWKLQAWANINRNGASNNVHYHPGAYWSGTFYVDDGGINGEENFGGAIEFLDPRGGMPMMYAPAVKPKFAPCLSAGLFERIYPKTGMLIMFPSWLQHGVMPYTGGGTRISIAFNCSLF